MDFTLINSFIAVAEEGSFSTAAKHLFLSQQSLSKQIAKLESELGT
ncbi:MAG: LysR family transcriptional regulator, partial [Ruminococcus sp.]|nr:LysR family transcriptional regulator [Ruminococcus sp.]